MEIAVLSGKGGTGKTTVVAALSQLAGKVMKVDCDVDAPNLYLFYKGEDIRQEAFFGGKKARIDNSLCIRCDMCEKTCKFGAVKNCQIDNFYCEGCGACTIVCPQNAITLEEEKTANTYITKTQEGIISRATMGIGSDGSGKLVTKLRKNAKQFTPVNITLLDGSPGIGCAVIASITDADVVLIVTEPTKSGLEDMKRILELARHFDEKVLVCINKYDINIEMTKEIEDFATLNQLLVVGRIPFDSKVMDSVNSLKPITEFEGSIAKEAIEEMWKTIKEHCNL